MKIGYFADGPWAHKALEEIASNELFDIAFIVPRYDVQDPVLESWAKRLEVDFLPIKDVNKSESVDLLSGYAADLFVSMSFNQILKKQIIGAAPLGFINCHAGALPFYRGRNPLNWALINDEKNFGVTVHYVNEDIDEGDIIAQKIAPIEEYDNYGTLLKKAVCLCAEVLLEALHDLGEGSVNRTPQKEIHPVGFYCGRRIPGDEQLDWTWTSRRLFNFIRAITFPGPCARTFLHGSELSVVSAEMIPGAPCYTATIGEVVGRDERGIVVKTGDSTLLVTFVSEMDNEGNHTNVRIPQYKIGTRFDVVVGRNI